MAYAMQPGNVGDRDPTEMGGSVPGASLAAGTRIATQRGEVLVEALRIGDLVTVMDGRPSPVLRTGQRRVDCARQAQPETLWPICIAAGAFAPGLPVHDLFLAPDHAIFAEEVLIPAGLLVNGSTVAPAAKGHIVYVDVVLGQHSIIYAEGLTVENARWRKALAAEEAVAPYAAGLVTPRADMGLPMERLRGRIARRAVMQTVRDMLDWDIAEAKGRRHSL